MTTAPSNSREPKVGDVVHVRMTVTRVMKDCIEAAVSDIRKMPLDPADIVHIEPAPLKVGDRVRIGNSASTATIRCIDGDDAWIKYECGDGHITLTLSDLTRIEASDGAGS